MNNIKEVNHEINEILGKIKSLNISDREIYKEVFLTLRLVEIEVKHKINIEALMSLWDLFASHDIKLIQGTLTDNYGEDPSRNGYLYSKIDCVLLENGSVLDEIKSFRIDAQKAKIIVAYDNGGNRFKSAEEEEKYNAVNVFSEVQSLLDLMPKEQVWGLSGRLSSMLSVGDEYSLGRDDLRRLILNYVGNDEGEELLANYERILLQKYTDKVHIKAKKSIKGL